MNIDRYRRLQEYNSWAHRRVWNCIMKLSEEQYHQPSSYSIGSLHQQLVHTMEVEMLLLRRVQRGTPHRIPPADTYPTREAVRVRWDEIEAAWREQLASLTDADLDVMVEYVSISSGKTYRSRMWELLSQWINHSTDHRAQMLALIHQLGGETISQDIIHFTWEHPAE
jgi:uncharacterized damage-inducible protein DinB